MKILEQALNKIKSINKNKRNFFMLLIQGLIGAAGKRTFRNLARYMQVEEHTISRQMENLLDFMSINEELIKLSKSDKDVLIAAQDTRYISKSGKKTYGLDYFWRCGPR